MWKLNSKLFFKFDFITYNQTLIIITHDMNIAKKADRIIKIEDGKISSDNQNVK